MFDRDLAELYKVTTFNLNKAVKRNANRFPDDFMFRLSKEEAKILIFQNGISRWGGTRKVPQVFTEQGVVMLSAVLKSKRAVQVSIQIARVFVQLREMLSTHKELREKIERMERKYDRSFKEVFDVIKRFIKADPKDSELKIIGFKEKGR